MLALDAGPPTPPAADPLGASLTGLGMTGSAIDGAIDGATDGVIDGATGGVTGVLGSSLALGFGFA
ncbi:MAG TPA: hypothetical protein VGC79_21795, partial [Polyangiaceae bacterium]